jgi:hypothetical protein
MALRQIIVYSDDVTGETVPSVTTETVCIGGTAYAVDMGPETRAAYEAAVAPYTTVGKRIGRIGGHMIPIGLASVKRTMRDAEQNKAVRDWWAKYGEAAELPPMSVRGRIPESVQAAFQEHQGGPPPAKPTRKPTSVGARVRVGAGKGPQKAAARARRAPRAS